MSAARVTGAHILRYATLRLEAKAAPAGRPVQSFRRTWAEACKQAGLPGLLFHDPRRSAVRNLERAGVSRSVAMKLTGHKTESVYRRYAIVAESDLREAGAKLNALSDNFGDSPREPSPKLLS